MKGSLGPAGVRAFALGGAMAFAASIAYGAYAYGVLFAQSAPFTVPGAPLMDVALFTAFGMHHSVFARRSAKAFLRARVAPEVERSLYVWIASALFFVMTRAWQPVAGDLWRAEGPIAWLIHAAQLAGALLGIAAGRRVDVRDLAGLGAANGAPGPQTRGPETPGSMEPVRSGPYGLVRHPLYLAFLILLWAVAVMTGTRLLFAGLFTAYVLVAIPLEERDLRRAFGEGYERYANKVRYRLFPGLY